MSDHTTTSIDTLAVEEICIEIPDLPLSINRMYKTSKFSKMYLSTEGKEFKRMVKTVIEKSNIHDQLTGNLTLYILFTLPDNIRRDIDNMLKIMLDSLQGYLFENDTQIFSILAEKRIEKGVRRTTIKVKANAGGLLCQNQLECK